MPEFLDIYIQRVKSNEQRISADYSASKLDLRDIFREYWVEAQLFASSPSDFSVLAIDSSSRRISTANGGVFYVVRALGVARGVRYRELIADFDYVSDTLEESTVVSRKMEWLEHRVAMKALEDGFSGYILFDGSIYGRVAHLPLETGFARDRAFMLDYFETLLELLDWCKRVGVQIIGIGKESRTSFFREFLLMKLALRLKDELGLNEAEIIDLLSLALDNKRAALRKLESEYSDIEFLERIVEELISKKPDFQLILEFAGCAGYTTPLLLGASARWRRAVKQILRDPEAYVRAQFPMCSRSEEFVDRAVEVVQRIPRMPAIVSFHILPSLNDTPMRIDVPAWQLGIDKTLFEVGWPEDASVDVSDILRLISAGYCGPENYNIWLKAADDGVRLSREIFENVYLQKFEEIVGVFITSRGYRRVRFP
ncbi:MULTISPECIES: DNA double-strand break repair nuclease NurA [unclassified Archaeoglobus]|jgi:hypothetical protein|uniref:DNA double-strand break repair nuclease NurA n=1 Tax=unclassified Archaeoglobus TaxID=2643606 RepID=UPI0025BC41A0|nr:MULTISPECIES: DNA double-strand break repair nuclease NurA [unclassified Archaeoglobus]